VIVWPRMYCSLRVANTLHTDRSVQRQQSAKKAPLRLVKQWIVRNNLDELLPPPPLRGPVCAVGLHLEVSGFLADLLYRKSRTSATFIDVVDLAFAMSTAFCLLGSWACGMAVEERPPMIETGRGSSR
jgi:hypothetical protein